MNLYSVCLCVCIFTLLRQALNSYGLIFIISLGYESPSGIYTQCLFLTVLFKAENAEKSQKEPSPSSFLMGSHLIGSCFCGSQLGYVKTLKETH